MVRIAVKRICTALLIFVMLICMPQQIFSFAQDKPAELREEQTETDGSGQNNEIGKTEQSASGDESAVTETDPKSGDGLAAGTLRVPAAPLRNNDTTTSVAVKKNGTTITAPRKDRRVLQ